MIPYNIILALPYKAQVRTSSYYGQRVFYGGAVGDNSPSGTVNFLDTLPDKFVDIRAEGFELDEFDEIQPWDRD